MPPPAPSSDASSRPAVVAVKPSIQIPGPDRPWRERLDHLVATMRDMSLHTDPQEMVEAYGERMRGYFQYDRMISLSRRDLAWPEFRITRSTTWEDTPDPWKQRDRLPRLKGGILADLIYGDQPRVINDLVVPEDDPAAEYLRGMRSIMAIPHYDKGVGLNMVVTMRREPDGFDYERVPEIFWMSNLFGRATGNLALARSLGEATSVIERELKIVADIQRSLLPLQLPKFKTLDLAAFYQTSKNAGGDYYDFFDLGAGRVGILIADVSGHGTPAAVFMAILHAIAHLAPRDEQSPGKTLEFINQNLTTRYTGEWGGGGTFVTAFYGIYDETTRTITYSSAGHPHPLIASRGKPGVQALDAAQSLPMGIERDVRYPVASHTLEPGDTLVMYTDGITEARGPGGRMYGDARLGGAVAGCPIKTTCNCSADDQLKAILEDVQEFADGTPSTDDRTIVVGRIS